MSLKELFTQRREAFDESTEKIFGLLSHVTSAVEEILGDENGEFTWEYTDKTGRVVEIIGFITYPLGHTIDLQNGHSIIVDEENQQELRRLVKLTIPFKIANTPDKEKAKEYFFKNSSIGSVGTEFNTDFTEKLKKEQGQGFDLDKLTKEQLIQMSVHAQQTTKGKAN